MDEGGGASLSTDPAAGTSSATDVSLREYQYVINLWRDRFDAERDRRYTEVNIEKEKALKIKEEADKRALDLQAETQAYKDEKANELREQINSERGRYLTREEYLAAHSALTDKIDAQFSPLNEFVNKQQGRSSGISSTAAVLYALAVIVINIALYYAAHH